jgi:nicotinamidase-related amidase
MKIIGGHEVLTTIEELVDPKHTALVMIDVQQDFTEPGMLTNAIWGEDAALMKAALPNIATAIKYARRAGVLPIFVQHTVKSDHITHSPVRIRNLTRELTVPDMKYGCIENTPGWQLCGEITPLPTEVVVRKGRASAFVGTDLDLILNMYDRKTIVLTGFLTNGCVLATTQGAISRDYYTVIATDCIATSQPDAHAAVLRYYELRHDTVTLPVLNRVWAAKA